MHRAAHTEARNQACHKYVEALKLASIAVSSGIEGGHLAANRTTQTFSQGCSRALAAVMRLRGSRSNMAMSRPRAEVDTCVE